MFKCLHCEGYETCKKYGDLDKAHLCNGPVDTPESSVCLKETGAWNGSRRVIRNEADKIQFQLYKRNQA